MIAHVLGLLTLVSQLALGAWLTGYLFHVGRAPYSWQQPIPTPRSVRGVPELSSGNDYVGWV